MPLFRKAQFFTTVAHLRDLPPESVAEVAFAGRSNAGKSSAINTLADHTRLAFVSKTPGRTQHLNYFQLAAGKFLVDLPGYGYAKAPEEVRDAWEGLIGPYLEGRMPLKGVVLIMDSRHPLTELDVQLIEWFAPTGKPIHILLTKADKLTRQQQAQTLRDVRAALAELGEQCSVQLFSSLKKTGIEVAEGVLGKWLDLAPAVAPAAPAKRVLAPGEKRNPELAARLAARKAAKRTSGAKEKAPGKGGTGG
ncbi:ribosome biogenesis GTP-binding protein YihA/YsxC [Azospira restricta]|uniref:Probable GTP-binding protein EngB n=1 Tax=Azospira restricta TaxID=404405 RepID=A0A974SRH4_9RHOO|nr:ribosome biogenesis GTP-binding protein YihA/YsxC [Azospira restricta]QRJ65111.1 YihA family ribosome biogenesis GTP-binding protein [Azospira restricta]